MKFSRPLYVLLLSLLSSCAAFQPTPDQLNQEISHYEKQHDYEDALRLIAFIPPGDPDYSHYAKRRKEIEAKIEAYSKDIIQQTDKLIAEGQWAEALNLYDEALDHLPSHSGLRDGLAALHQQQVTAAEVERSRILIARGQWLEQSLPVTRKIATILPRDDKAQEDLRRREKDAQEAAEQLAEVGDNAMQNEDYKLAEQTLPLAARLSDSESIQQSLATLKEYQANKKKKGKRAAERRKARLQRRQQQRKKEIQRLTKLYNQTFGKGQYLQAREHLEKLSKLKPTEVPVEAMRTTLEKTILNKAEEHYQQGVKLYSRNQFEAALAEWEKALKLNPKHQLAKENADRARKVVKKLEELRNK